MADPAIQAALGASQKVSSDRELRESSRRYYGLFFAKMRQLDPSLEKLIAEREAEALKPLKEKAERRTHAADTSKRDLVR
jgi:hypothetical protein